MTEFHLLLFGKFSLLTVSCFLLLSIVKIVEGQAVITSNGKVFRQTKIPSSWLGNLRKSEYSFALNMLVCAMKNNARLWSNMFCYKDQQCSLYEFAISGKVDDQPIVLVDHCWITTGMCPAPFDLDPYAGCVHFGSRFAYMNNAKLYCAVLGAELFIANNAKHLQAAWNYLVRVYSAGSDWFMWVGIEGDKWLDGRLVTEWAAGETPTANTCSLMTGSPKILAVSCSQGNTYSTLCSL